MTAVFHRMIDLGTTVPSFYTATEKRIVVIENITRVSATALEVRSFNGELLDRVPRVGVAVRCGTMTNGELVVGGQGRAASIALAAKNVAQWKLRPSSVWTTARYGRTVAWATAVDSPDAVFWQHLGEQSPTPVAKLLVGTKQGWRRPPYLLHAIDETRWWLASEHRLALVDIAGSQPRIEQLIDVPFIATQVKLIGTTAFALQVRGRYWQWRDGDLRMATSHVHGGSPPDPQEVMDEAQLFRVDLTTGQLLGSTAVRAGMIIRDDDDGLAIARTGGLDRVSAQGSISETLALPIPATEMQYVEPSPHNSTAAYANHCIGPGELLVRIATEVRRETTVRPENFRHELLHLAWGRSIAAAEARHRG